MGRQTGRRLNRRAESFAGHLGHDDLPEEQLPIPIRTLATAAAGTAASLALAAPALAQEPVPASAVDATLRCVQRLDVEDFTPAEQAMLEPNERYLLARFGVRNNTQEEVSAEGVEQRLTPETSVFAQTAFPGAFAPGEHDEDALGVVFKGDDLKWSLIGGQVSTAATASSAFADRCLTMYGSSKTEIAGDRAHLVWHSHVSGENRDGLGLSHWEGWTKRACTLSKDGQVIEASDDCGTRVEESLKPWVTFSDLKPGSYEFIVSGGPPRLCPSAQSREDCIPYTAPDSVRPIGDETSVNSRIARVTFRWAVSAPPAPTPPATTPNEQPPAPQPPAKQPVQVIVPPINNELPAPPIVEPRACTPRTLKIKVPAPRGKRVRSATVKVNGRKVHVRNRNGRLVAIVHATAASPAKVTVKITVRYTDGTRKAFRYRLRTCF